MLEVKEQVRLPFRRLLEICLDTISHRLMRSLVTMAIITLAIAFLASIMVKGYLGRAVRDAVQSERRSLTAYSHFLGRVSRAPAEEELLELFAEVREGSADYENLRQWSGLKESEVQSFISLGREARRYLDFFQSMPLGRRVLLVEQQTGTHIFDWLARPKNQEEFRRRLDQMKSVRLPGGLEEFALLLAEWPEFRLRLDRARTRNAAAVRRILDHCRPEGIAARLRQHVAAADEATFFGELAALGMRFDEQDIPRIVAGVEGLGRLEWALALLRRTPVRTGWHRKFTEDFSPGLALRSIARHPDRVEWVEETLAKADLAAGFDAEKLRRTARETERRQQLLSAEQQLVARYGKSRRLGGKAVWLITISFLVCVVGIANAMLMSVLERFKEIATIKCLGARNETIAALFVIESIFLGMLGGLVGIVLGFAIEFGRQLASYQSLVFANFPAVDMARAFAVCLACSLGLAVIAAIYPAIVAAKMAPMEAMRVD